MERTHSFHQILRSICDHTHLPTPLPAPLKVRNHCHEIETIYSEETLQTCDANPRQEFLLGGTDSPLTMDTMMNFIGMFGTHSMI